ncbi:hypothetical protein MY5147_005309 [Beauveria neobassiana]
MSTPAHNTNKNIERLSPSPPPPPPKKKMSDQIEAVATAFAAVTTDDAVVGLAIVFQNSIAAEFFRHFVASASTDSE